mgnify:CR=1 FL=1
MGSVTEGLQREHRPAVPGEYFKQITDLAFNFELYLFFVVTLYIFLFYINLDLCVLAL